MHQPITNARISTGALGALIVLVASVTGCQSPSAPVTQAQTPPPARAPAAVPEPAAQPRAQPPAAPPAAPAAQPPAQPQAQPQGRAVVGDCVQPRFTQNAPPEFYNLRNAIAQPTEADFAAGREIFMGDGKKASCASCHGEQGNGKGPMSDQFDPPPRDFACKAIKQVSDGHLFWIIRFGSPGTSMPAHRRLKEAQVWQLVHYLRRISH